MNGAQQLKYHHWLFLWQIIKTKGVYMIKCLLTENPPEIAGSRTKTVSLKMYQGYTNPCVSPCSGILHGSMKAEAIIVTFNNALYSPLHLHYCLERMHFAHYFLFDLNLHKITLTLSSPPSDIRSLLSSFPLMTFFPFFAAAGFHSQNMSHWLIV